LAAQYRVYAVPRTVINEREVIEGSVPEAHFLDRVLNAIKQNDEQGTMND